jgi:hypothetical protein
MLSLSPNLDARSDLAPPPTASGSAAGYLIAFRPLASLQASEQVHPDRVQALAQRIRDDGRWLAPLPIDEATGVVMDGNHRLRAARLLGLRRLPCVLLDYADPRVAVDCWRSGRPIDPRDIFTALASCELLPPKSTRHRFDPPLPATRFELALLS